MSCRYSSDFELSLSHPNSRFFSYLIQATPNVSPSGSLKSMDDGVMIPGCSPLGSGMIHDIQLFKSRQKCEEMKEDSHSSICIEYTLTAAASTESSMTLPVSALSSSGETAAAGAVPVSAPPRHSGGRGLSPQSSLKKWSRRSPPEIRNGKAYFSFNNTYSVAQVDVENLPLSLNWDVPPCCLGNRKLQ